jgi:hypothetical protein
MTVGSSVLVELRANSCGKRPSRASKSNPLHASNRLYIVMLFALLHRRIRSGKDFTPKSPGVVDTCREG